MRISKQLQPKAQGSWSHDAFKRDQVFLEQSSDNRGHLRSSPCPNKPITLSKNLLQALGGFVITQHRKGLTASWR